MDFTALIAEARRKAEFRRQTEAAEFLEHSHEIANANKHSAGFVINVIFPMLQRAEDDLRAAGIIAMTTSKFNERRARCMLSASIDEDTPPSCLAFEARTGGTSPKVSWTSGGSPPATIPDLNPAAVRRVIEEFIGRVIH
jgi:hypothetical protein